MGREEDRARLGELLAIGARPRSPAPACKVLDVEDSGGATLERLLLDLNGEEPVPAYYLRPKGRPEPGPAVLYSHSHGGNYERGKQELLSGAEYLQSEPYGAALVRAGYSALCCDAWCFGDRRGRTETAAFKSLLWRGESLWGRMVYDALRAVDYLAGRPDVDPARIGALGMSMGGTLSWWVAALEPRIAACASLCSLTDYHTLDRLGAHDRHGVYYYVPGLLREFSTSRIASLIAPRWHLSQNGAEDPLTPSDGFPELDARLSEAYAHAGAPERWRLRTYPCGHYETAGMREETLAFLKLAL